MATVQRRYVLRGAPTTGLTRIVAPSAIVKSVFAGWIEIEYDDAVSGTTETLDEFMATLGYAFDAAAGPPRVLNVAPNGAYTTIQSGIDAAVALFAPTSANPALVLIAPGTYVENVALAPFVYLQSMDNPSGIASSAKSVIISGNLSAVSTSAVSENYSATGMNVNGTTTLSSVGNTGAGASFISFTFTNVRFGNTTAITGRAAFPASDSCRMIGSRPFGVTVTDMTYVSHASAHVSTTTGNGASAFTLVQASTAGTVVLNGTSTWSQDSGTVGAVTANAGTTADIRGVGRMGALAGAGAINRSIVQGQLAASAIGANAIAIVPPLMDANYKVFVTQAAGVPAVAFANAYAAGGFNIAALGAGDTYDWCVVHA